MALGGISLEQMLGFMAGSADGVAMGGKVTQPSDLQAAA